MRITIRPILDPRREVDLTHRLTAAIAEELWMLYGGNSQLNWLEAERHLARIATPGEAGGAAAQGAADRELLGARRGQPSVPGMSRLRRPRRPVRSSSTRAARKSRTRARGFNRIMDSKHG